MNLSNKLLRQSAILLGAGLTLHASHSLAARCEYIVQSDWNTGFVAAVRITNDTSTPINGWSVNWSYSDGSTRTGGWNANISGNNPYVATGVGWNDRINPGQTIEFGVQGNKGVANTPAQRPVISGAVCAGAVTSSVPSSVASTSSRASSSSSSLPPSSISSSRSSTSLPASTSSSSSSSSSFPNTAPVADLQVTAHGLTVAFNARNSTDVDGQPLQYTVNFGDGTSINYPEPWHTYKEPGEYNVVLTVSDGIAQTTATQLINVQPVEGNRAPIARLTAVFERYSLIGHGQTSFDEEGTPLTYEWDFGQGVFEGNRTASSPICNTSSSSSSSSISYQRTSGTATLTVSDGELKDTIQRSASGTCGYVMDLVPSAAFAYRVEGNTIFVDGSASRDETGFSWEFGDGATAQGLLASHTYATPGVYDVRLKLSGPSLFSATTTKSVNIGSVSSVSSSNPGSSSAVSSTASSVPSSQVSSSRSSSSAIISSQSSSVVFSSSALSSSSSQASSIPNHYNAPRATTAPVIDGSADAVWERAAWTPIDVFWLGTQANPSAQDYSGRYKALWDEDYLYLLVDITDDVLYDGVRDPLDRYWEDDTVELFIDENKNGGQHGYNTSAWAYHISTYLDVVDSTTGGAKLLNDHIDSRLVSVGNKHMWELRIRIYGEDYADWKANTPLKLFSGKLMGFSASYIDNDGSSQRESMMGSVNTAGHKNNQGYLDASVFGSLRLVE